MDFCIHNDHYHLIVIQVREGGISEFMKRFPNSISRRLNEKYGGVGSVFQGPYQIRRVDEETDLRNLGLYVRVKNPFERYSYGGLEGAKKNFENAWKDMINDPFSSLPDYADVRNSPIIDKGMMGNLFSDSQKFKKEANEYLKNYERVDSGLEHLVIE